MERPCDQCPWRKENQGKRHPGGFYRKDNLTRLWNQIRRGGGMQSCHLTDPSHPDHIKHAGTKPGAEARECPGSVVIVMKEIALMVNEEGVVDVAGLKRYQATRKRGLTRSGILHWVVQRLKMGGVPYMGGSKLPDVDWRDSAIGLPSFLVEDPGPRLTE